MFTPFLSAASCAGANSGNAAPDDSEFENLILFQHFHVPLRYPCRNLAHDSFRFPRLEVCHINGRVPLQSGEFAGKQSRTQMLGDYRKIVLGVRHR
jgi:hypothetical protein